MLNGEKTAAAAAGTWVLGDQQVRRMGFGSMRLTVDPDPETAVRVLRRAVELGVDHLDTAAFYFSPGGILDGHDGPARYATELIRRALTPYPEGLFLATKVGPGILPDGQWGEARTTAELRYQVEENLRRLRVDRLDLVNLRVFRSKDAIAERFAALADMRAEGLIRHLGLSTVSMEQLDEASTVAPVVCVQNSFAIDLPNNAEMLRVCGERGIAFVPFFAIAGTGRENGASADHDAAVEAVAARHGVSGPQVRLAWTLHQGDHVLAIPGTGSVRHLEANVAAAALRLTDQDLAALRNS
ncbi:oxidoreductase [Paractinoplanes ferrugineus]|uniref:Oxidoreductase n=1 Tax=Paractinoplanes ferrugineus TaxID=113564 RepID=A0A919J807_9ACTN|nr:aldo/keto reductase [Actinoplanes ferrugineus]GIE14713.1 oxidoreductase [Actinoplanes ferrugineus]